MLYLKGKIKWEFLQYQKGYTSEWNRNCWSKWPKIHCEIQNGIRWITQWMLLLYFLLFILYNWWIRYFPHEWLQRYIERSNLDLDRPDHYPACNEEGYGSWWPSSELLHTWHLALIRDLRLSRSGQLNTWLTVSQSPPVMTNEQVEYWAISLFTVTVNSMHWGGNDNAAGFFLRSENTAASKLNAYAMVSLLL